MSGIYGNSQEDRIREAELNRHLDSQFGDEQKLSDITDEIAYDRIADSGYLQDMFVDDTDELFEKLAFMVRQSRKHGEAASALYDFCSWLEDQMKEEKNTQIDAAYQLQQQLEYQED